MRELGNRGYIAITLDGLGRVPNFQGDYPAARMLCDESLAIMRELRVGCCWSTDRHMTLTGVMLVL